MNPPQPLTHREKIFAIIITLLIAIQLTGWQPTQAASDPYYQYSDRQLYEKAEEYSQNGNIVSATIYLFAYMQRNPSKYANNTGGYRSKIDQVYKNWLDTVLNYQYAAKETSMHVASCDQYPCDDGESQTLAMFARAFPPEMVRICKDKSYRGDCAYLALGEYTRLGGWNDTISSIEVGSEVQVLLCVHNLDRTGDCLAFTSSDSNLGTNWLPGKNYTLNDNISSIRVTYRYGKNLTLP